MPAPGTDAAGLERVLDAAERHVHEVRAGGSGDHPWLLVVVASLPSQVSGALLGRLAALTHAGPQSRVHLLFCGYREAGPYQQPPPLENTALLRLVDGLGWLGNPAGERYGDDGLNAPIRLDAAPSAAVVETVCQGLADTARAASVLRFADLIPAEPWQESSATGLRTAIGRTDRQVVELAFDDVPPHWLVGGRTGSGKTVFLLDVLYGLASRYDPDELALFLLDFKEGSPSPSSPPPSWTPPGSRMPARSASSPTGSTEWRFCATSLRRCPGGRPR